MELIWREKNILQLMDIGGWYGKDVRWLYGKECIQGQEEPEVFDPAIPLSGIHLKELQVGSQRDICTPTFTAALLTMAKRWKHLRCPLTAEWISKWNIIKP